MKLDVVDACFIGIAARSHGKIKVGEGLVSEILMACYEHGVALPAQRKRRYTKFVQIGNMPLHYRSDDTRSAPNTHQTCCWETKKSSVEDKALRHFNVSC